MNFMRRSIYISLPVGVLLSGCSHLDTGRISEAGCIHNFDVRQDGSVWEQRLQKSAQGWTLKDIPVYNNIPSHAVASVGSYPFKAVDYPHVVMSPQWVKYNPHGLVKAVQPPKMLLVVLGQTGQPSAVANGGYIYYIIMHADGEWGSWHSKSDKGMDPAKTALVTTPLQVQSLNVTTGFSGNVTIKASKDDQNATLETWSGMPDPNNLDDFAWKQR